MTDSEKKYIPLVMLAFITLLSLYFKLPLLNVGAPYTTIDDHTLFNAGFLVWFGDAPPQRTYIESWIVGLCSIATYIFQLLTSGHVDQLGLNLIADAYRSFTENPDPYVHTYRALMLMVDFATVAMVYLLAIQILRSLEWRQYAAVTAAGLYLLSYNTLWCFIVSRPDTATAFFCTAGLYFYYRSHFGEKAQWFFLAALTLGIATGYKLHAALLVVFLLLDVIRHHGLRQAAGRVVIFGTLSFFAFMIFAGTTLFDPLLYIKLRALNAKDDASPWIHWGEQFVVLLNGSGWIVIPLVLSLLFKRPAFSRLPPFVASALFVSIGLIISYAAIRQLRAYWMLPALPLLYVLAAYTIYRIERSALRYFALGVMFFIFIMQCVNQASDFQNAEYAQLKRWVQQNVKPDEPIYIIGFDTLFLPKNSQCLANRRKILEAELNQALVSNESFTKRHIRLWEERSELRLIDMLNTRSSIGFNYYGTNFASTDIIKSVVPFSSFDYVFVMHGYTHPELDYFKTVQPTEFVYIATLKTPGGKAGTGGLPFDIYRRKN